MSSSHYGETRSSEEINAAQNLANRDEEYSQRGKKLAAAFQEATGIEAKPFLSSTRFVDPEKPLIKIALYPTNDSSKNMDNIIDRALIPFREKAGLTREDIGFAMSEKGPGPLSAGKIIVQIKWDMKDPTYDDKIIELLKNNSAELKENIRKTELNISKNDSAERKENFQLASKVNLGELPKPVIVALSKPNNGLEIS